MCVFVCVCVLVCVLSILCTPRYMCDMTHSCVWHDSLTPRTSYARVNSHLEVTHWYVWHDSFIWVTWLIHTCVIWLIHMCDMTHSYVWHDSRTCTHLEGSFLWYDPFINIMWSKHTRDMTHSCVTWLIQICDMTHSYVWRDSLIQVTWLTHTWDMTNPRVRHDSFVGHASYICGPWFIHMSNVSLSDYPFVCGTSRIQV